MAAKTLKDGSIQLELSTANVLFDKTHQVIIFEGRGDQQEAPTLRNVPFSAAHSVRVETIPGAEEVHSLHLVFINEEDLGLCVSRSRDLITQLAWAIGNVVRCGVEFSVADASPLGPSRVAVDLHDAPTGRYNLPEVEGFVDESLLDTLEEQLPPNWWKERRSIPPHEQQTKRTRPVTPKRWDDDAWDDANPAILSLAIGEIEEEIDVSDFSTLGPDDLTPELTILEDASEAPTERPHRKKSGVPLPRSPTPHRSGGLDTARPDRNASRRPSARGRVAKPRTGSQSGNS